MSTERITSERNLREQFNAIAVQLRGVEQLIADLRSARERVQAFAEQAEASGIRFSAELEKAQHARHQLDEAIGEQRRAIEAVSVERVRLIAELEIAEAASGRFANDARELGTALSRELQQQLTGLRDQIAKAAAEENLALDARQKEYVAATRAQLEDVLRAYQLASARQQEVERAFGDRLTGVESALPVVRETVQRAIDDERAARTLEESSSRSRFDRSHRLILFAIILAGVAVLGAMVSLYLALGR